MAPKRSTTIHDLKPDPKNARIHSDRNRALIEQSIERDGFGRSVLLASDGTIIAGNATIEAAIAKGMDDVIVVETDGRKVIAVKRTDIDPDSPEFFSLAISDNRAGELSEWNTDILQASEADLSGWWFVDELAELFGTTEPVPDDSPNLYSRDTPSPIYTPTGERPDVSALMDTSRRDVLMIDIATADLPDDVRKFLTVAASRHVVFDYRMIANFYAHADPETQRLMEDSALVIIDFNRAIELGYVRLSKRLDGLLDEAMEDDDDDDDDDD